MMGLPRALRSGNKAAFRADRICDLDHVVTIMPPVGLKQNTVYLLEFDVFGSVPYGFQKAG